MTQNIIEDHIQPDTFTHLILTFQGNVGKSFNQLLGTFKLQFAQDETSIGLTHLTKM